MQLGKKLENHLFCISVRILSHGYDERKVHLQHIFQLLLLSKTFDSGKPE